MQKSNYLVSINKPCHENWENMTQSNQGKFCASCAKNVIDFSKMSDKEIINVLEQNSGKNSGNLCGRFQQKQLNRTILYENKTNNFTKFYQILSGLLFFSFAESTAEVIKPRTSISPTRTDISESKDSLKMPPKNETLKGKIIDKKGEAIPGVNINIKNTTLIAVSDDNGEFSIFISDTLKMDTLTVQIDAMGYEITSLSIKRDEIPLYVEIVMKEEEMMGAVVISAGMMSYHQKYKPWQKGWWRGSTWRYRWNRITNVFRRND